MMLLEMAAGGFGERVAFTDPRAETRDGASITYQQLYDAAGWAGVPYVPINYRLTAQEVDALLARVQPAYLVTDVERVPRFAGRDGVTLRERDSFLAAARAGGASDEQRSMDPDDVGVLLFTSGTTGAPKAAMLRHRHLVSYILSSVEFHSAAEEEAALVCVPPYHIAGIAATLSSVYAGRRVVQLPNFSADAWIDAARAERITTAFVVPTMLARIVAALAPSRRNGLLPPTLAAPRWVGSCRGRPCAWPRGATPDRRRTSALAGARWTRTPRNAVRTLGDRTGLRW